MMMMPFVRLLAIYALVGAAIFAFLKRDELVEYFAAPEAEITVQAAPTPTVITTPEVAPAPQTQPVAPVAPVAQAQPAAPTPQTPATPQHNGPRFGSDVTPQYFGQTALNRTVQTPAPAALGSDLVSRWKKAREVYNQGNIDEASQLYEALTDSFPNNADLHGETGNLYYNLGQFAKAAEHYYAVGEISVHNGNMAMAASMFSLLQRIAPAKANDLQAVMAGQR